MLNTATSQNPPVPQPGSVPKVKINENFGRIVHFIRYSNYPPPIHAHGNIACQPIDFIDPGLNEVPMPTRGLSLPIDHEETVQLPAPGDFLYAPINSDESLTGRVFRCADPAEMTWQLTAVPTVLRSHVSPLAKPEQSSTKATPVKNPAREEFSATPSQFVPVYTPPSPEREREWKDCCDQAIAAAQKNHFDDAEKLLLQALEIAGEFHNRDPRLPQTLDKLTNLYYNLGDYSKAQAFALQTLEKTRNVYGHMHSKVASCMNNIAGIYFCQNLHHRAEPYCLEVLEIYENIYPIGHPDIGMAHNNLGFLYHAQGNFKIARAHYEAALPVRRQALGCHHPSVRLLIDGYTELLEAMGEGAQAQFIRATKSDNDSGWNLFSKQIVMPRFAS